MKLTSQVVDDMMLKCLFGDSEQVEKPIMVEGIARNFGFHPARIAEHRDEIKAMLAELPDAFQATKGGGWSFLNACLDRHDVQWTGLHMIMESLFCLGIAAGLARWTLPRHLWHVFPGGMPYVTLTLDPKE